MASTARLAAAAPAIAPPSAQKRIQPEIFNDAFIERRMREHNDWREFAERVFVAGIIHEVSTGVFNQDGLHLVHTKATQ